MSSTTTPSPAPTRGRGWIRYTVLAMLFVVTVVNYADRSTISIAGDDIQKSLGLSSQELGFILSGFGWSYLVAQIPGGWLLDKYGAKRVYGWALFAWSAITALQGFIDFFTFLSPIALFFILRLLVGVAEAPSFPGNASILASWFPTQTRGRAVALINAAQYFGTVVFSPLMGWLVYSFGWQHVFWVVGGFGVILSGIWLVTIYTPRRHPRLSAQELDYLEKGGALVDMERNVSNAAAKLPFRVTLARLRFLLSRRLTLGVFCGQYFLNSITWFFLTWFPVYLVQERGMNILEAGFVTALPAICGFVGGIAGGALSDTLRHRLSHSVARKIPMGIGLVLAVSIIACNYIDTNWLIVTFMSLAFFGKGFGALGWVLVVDIAPAEFTGLTGSVFNTFGAVASITTPLIVGAIVDSTGSFELALLFIGANALLAAVCFLFLTGKIRRLVAPAQTLV